MLRANGKVQQSNAIFKIRLVRRLMERQVSQKFGLLFTPLGRHLVKELAVDTTVQLVRVHCVEAVLDSIVFALQP
ncbi:hypothetical protein BSN85_16275 [Bradyrhizobium brasilense]|nr:hypothetical protein BSN85_16275 [Bradyrhizobium brasilense]